MGRLSVLIDVVRSIRDQAAGGDEVTFEIDRGQFVPGRQCDDQIAMARRSRARRRDQTAIQRAREGRDCLLGGREGGVRAR
jgi:hypothetical protein